VTVARKTGEGLHCLEVARARGGSNSTRVLGRLSCLSVKRGEGDHWRVVASYSRWWTWRGYGVFSQGLGGRSNGSKSASTVTL